MEVRYFNYLALSHHKFYRLNEQKKNLKNAQITFVKRTHKFSHIGCTIAFRFQEKV